MLEGQFANPTCILKGSGVKSLWQSIVLCAESVKDHEFGSQLSSVQKVFQTKNIFSNKRKNECHEFLLCQSGMKNRTHNSNA